MQESQCTDRDAPSYEHAWNYTDRCQCGRYTLVDGLVETVTEAQRKFEKIGTEIGQLVQQKNDAYGDSFKRCHRIMQELYPNGISVDQMLEALLLLRMVDKFFRIAGGKRGAFNEDAWRDLAGYGICGTSLDKSDK